MSEREKHTLLTSRGVVADLFDAQPRRGGRRGSEGFLVLRVSLNALREALKQAPADTQADELVRALDDADAVSNELLIAPGAHGPRGP